MAVYQVQEDRVTVSQLFWSELASYGAPMLHRYTRRPKLTRPCADHQRKTIACNPLGTTNANKHKLDAARDLTRVA
jgi:hypothetical protein